MFLYSIVETYLSRPEEIWAVTSVDSFYSRPTESVCVVCVYMCVKPIYLGWPIEGSMPLNHSVSLPRNSCFHQPLNPFIHITGSQRLFTLPFPSLSLHFFSLSLFLSHIHVYANKYQHAMQFVHLAQTSKPHWPINASIALWSRQFI